MDLSDKIATFGLSVSGLLFYGFYKMYRSRYSTADAIRKSDCIQLKNLHEALNQAPDNTIAYATLEGIVQPLFEKLESNHGTMDGVVKMVQKVEHRSRRNQGYWSDATRIMQNTIDSVPFKLVEPYTKNKVDILEVQNADFLQEELTITFDNFEPLTSSLLKTGIERMFGEVTKGFQSTEKMLLVGTHLFGIGEVCMEHGKAVLGPPSDGRPYILTKLSKGAVIRKFETQALVYKVWTVILGSVTAGIIVYLLYKCIRWMKVYRQTRAIYAEIRSIGSSVEHDGEAGGVDQMCVICLSRPRNIVVMNCRHVCLCSVCAQLLSHPLMCPICRQPAEQFLPLYNA